MVQYMSILKAYTYLSMGSLSLVEQSLYFRLFLVNNLAGWGNEWFGADNKRLMFETGIGSSATLNKAKQRLKDLGYIDFKSGKKGQPSLYKLMPLHEKFYSLAEQNTKHNDRKVSVSEQNTTPNAEQNPIPNSERIKDNRHETRDNTTPHTPQGGFEEFWKAYPRKQGIGAAEKSFKKIKPSRQLLDKMLEVIALWKKSPQWTKDNGQYIPLPSTWLNQRRWEDEICQSAPSDGMSTAESIGAEALRILGEDG